jgi:hypothetical protein
LAAYGAVYAPALVVAISSRGNDALYLVWLARPAKLRESLPTYPALVIRSCCPMLQCMQI